MRIAFLFSAAAPPRRPRQAAALNLALVLVMWLSGCAAPQSTTLRAADFDNMADAMAQSLLRSPALAERTPDSEPWTISIQKVTNLSGDVIPVREQWAVMAMLRGSVPIRELRDLKNVSFTLPAERVEMLRADDNRPELAGFGDERAVTHVMTATIRSVTRTAADARTDLYYAEFDLMDLARGVPVWNDKFELKRQALGSLRD